MKSVIASQLLIIAGLLANCNSESHTSVEKTIDSSDQQVSSVTKSKQPNENETKMEFGRSKDCALSEIGLTFSLPDDDSVDLPYPSFVRTLEERGVTVVPHTVDSVHSLLFVTLKVSDKSAVVQLANEPGFRSLVRIPEQE
ncbi:MAG: hypothetical protein K9N23_04270 [Akkermansiaceae bacterium]|nr:hypothetical protein [Akkermansiaceae bacterium]